MKPRKRIGPAYIFPMFLLGITAALFAVSVFLEFTGGSMSRIYNDIGALPWSKPEVKISVGGCKAHSREEVMAAAKAAVKTYEEDWYTYNGVYLLQLTYSEEFSESKKDENEGDWIYFGSSVYTGYDSSIEPQFRGVFHSEAYWAVEKQPDGSWVCHGCGKLG